MYDTTEFNLFQYTCIAKFKENLTLELIETWTRLFNVIL